MTSSWEFRHFDVGGGVVVEAACRPSSAELHRNGGADAESESDLTGHVPWLACLPLCTHLARTLVRASPPPVALRVVELGAGVGLPGLVAGRVASALVLTDNSPPVLAQLEASLRRNVANGRAPAGARVAALSWGSGALPAGLERAVDLVLAADCVYYAGSARALLRTALRLLAPGGVLLLSHTSRWEETDRELCAAARELGLGMAVAPGAAPPTAHESGRVARVLELRARPPRSRPELAPSLERALAHASALGCRVWAAEAEPAAAGAEEGRRGGESGQRARAASPPRSVGVRGVGPLALTPDAVDELLRALGADARAREAVRELSLSGHWLHPEALLGVGGDGVAHALASCAALTALDVSANALGSAGAGVPSEASEAEHRSARAKRAALCAAVRACSGLRALRVAACELSEADALELARALADACPELRALDASANPIGDGGALALARTLAPHRARDGEMQSPPAEMQSARTAAAAGATPPPAELLLAYTRLSAEGTPALAASLPAGLHRLDLSGQWLGDDGCSQLARNYVRRSGAADALTHLRAAHATSGWGAATLVAAAADAPCARLVELVLRGDRIGDTDGARIASALGCSPVRASLQRLDLRANQLGWEGAEALAAALASCAALVELRLDDNPLGDEGVDALADALAGTGVEGEPPLRPPPALRSLGLSGVGCGDEGLEAVGRAAAALVAGSGCASLREIDLRRNALTPAGAARALECIAAAAMAAAPTAEAAEGWPPAGTSARPPPLEAAPQSGAGRRTSPLLLDLRRAAAAIADAPADGGGGSGSTSAHAPADGSGEQRAWEAARPAALCAWRAGRVRALLPHIGDVGADEGRGAHGWMEWRDASDATPHSLAAASATTATAPVPFGY